MSKGQLVLYQALAALLGFMAGAYIMLNAWISMINNSAGRLSPLEVSMSVMWADGHEGMRMSTILAGVTGGLLAIVILRSSLVLNVTLKPRWYKVIVGIIVLLGLVAVGLFMLASISYSD